MYEENTLTSQVLIFDNNPQSLGFLVKVCHETSLTLLKAKDVSLSILDANIDLGAIFISHDSLQKGDNAFINKISESKRDIPIFIGLPKGTNEVTVKLPDKLSITCFYSEDKREEFLDNIRKYIFSRYYPSQITHAISTSTLNVFSSYFKGCKINSHLPYLVMDHYVYGDVLTMVPIKTNWCSGYMMLQVQQNDLLRWLTKDTTGLKTIEEVNFRDINELLKEATNQVWGRVRKDLFHNNYEPLNSDVDIQVPIITNHIHHYMSFGSEAPQLSIQYDISDEDDTFDSFSIKQKFVFNVQWIPEEYKPKDSDIDTFLESGELELF